MTADEYNRLLAAAELLERCQVELEQLYTTAVQEHEAKIAELDDQRMLTSQTYQNLRALLRHGPRPLT